jgi:hypothetical protein
VKIYTFEINDHFHGRRTITITHDALCALLLERLRQSADEEREKIPELTGCERYDIEAKAGRMVREAFK